MHYLGQKVLLLNVVLVDERHNFKGFLGERKELFVEENNLIFSLYFLLICRHHIAYVETSFLKYIPVVLNIESHLFYYKLVCTNIISNSDNYKFITVFNRNVLTIICVFQIINTIYYFLKVIDAPMNSFAKFFNQFSYLLFLSLYI